MKFFKYIFTVLLTAGFLSACDHLDREPLDTVSTETFFRNANGAALELYANSFYTMINGHGGFQSYGFGMLEGDFVSDNLLPWSYNQRSFGHNVAPTSANQNIWNWGNIRRANNYLKYYELSSATETEKNRVLGQVLFFKSYDYFNKLMDFGNLPWYDEVLETGGEALYKGRDSRETVVTNIVRDLDQAISILPRKSSVSRVSKDAALALKARVCLFEGSWRKYHGGEGANKYFELARDAAAELMKPEYGYSLFKGSSPNKSYYELFIQSTYRGNSEVILSKEYDPGQAMANNVSRQIGTGENPFGMSKSMADDYLSIDGLPLASSPLHNNNESFIAELKNRDPRMLQTVATPEPGEFTYYLDGKRPAIANLFNSLQAITLNGETIDITSPDNNMYKWADKGASSTGYAVVKFYNPAEDVSAHHQGSIDAPIFRFAEILLIYAEAHAELGTATQAVLDASVNKLRERVGFDVKLTTTAIADPRQQAMYPNVTGANADLIREIRRERRVELMGEGLRFYDILRWKVGNVLNEKRAGFQPDPSLYSPEEIERLTNQMGILPAGTINVYDKRVATPPSFEERNYLLSLPINEMALNPNLKPNNPGWD